MRRKSKKSEPENNGVSDDTSNVDQAEESNPDSPEPEPKKRKSGKRSSVKETKEKKSDKPKEKVKDDTEDSEEDEPEYEVESIIEKRTIKGVTQFLIKWKGFDASSNSWETEEDVNCPELIEEFETSRKNNTNAKSPTKEKRKPSKGKVKKSKKEEVSEWDGNEDFEVDRILEVHFKRSGKKAFLVSWKGYPPSQNSWVDEEDMDCKDLIERFMTKVDKAKNTDQKELRINRAPTDRFTLTTREFGRRLSKRNVGKQRLLKISPKIFKMNTSLSKSAAK